MRVNWWKWHKWLALVVGLQVLAWAASGLFMSAVPIERVRGEHLVREAARPDLRQTIATAAPAADPATLGTSPPTSSATPAVTATALSAALAPVLGSVQGPVDALELTQVDGRTVWRVQQGKHFTLVDATHGAVLSPLDAATARRIAAADYAGPGGVKSVTLLQAAPPIEYRGPLPVWQVQFNDPEGLRVYVSPATGKVVARRTNTWRIYDFLWSLHIMDYREHEDFNHPLLITCAAALLALALSGTVLLWRRFRGARGTLLCLLLLPFVPEGHAATQPPMNPYLAQTFNNQGHWNDAATDATDLAVPRGHYLMTPDGAEVVPSDGMGIPFYQDQVAGKEVYWFWAGFSMRKLHRENGRFVEIDRVDLPTAFTDYRPVSAEERFAQAREVRRFLDARDEAGLLAYLRAQPNRMMSAIEDQVRLGILYSLITREDAFIGSNARGLIRIDQQDPRDPYSKLRAPQRVTLPDNLFDDSRAKANTIFPTDTVFGLGMTFNGFLVINTIGGRIVTLDRQSLAVIDVYHAEAADEVFTNSFATSAECNGGAIYVASNTTMYRLVVDAQGRIHTDPATGAWQAKYDRGVRLPFGKIADGTGATPTLMGFGRHEDQLVVITDGAKKMRLVAFWRNEIPRHAKRRKSDFPDPRIADQIEVDLGPAVDVVQSEQSVVAQGGYAFVINNVPATKAAPYLAPGSYYRGLLMGSTREAPSGAAMFRWNAREGRWRALWQRRDIALLATVPMLSGGSRMVALNGHYVGHLNRLFHLGLDLDTGATVMSIDSGSDPLFNGSFTGLKCDRDGNLFYTTMFGLVRFDTSRMQRVNTAPEARLAPPEERPK